MVCTQIVFLLLVQVRLQFHSIALVVEAQVALAQIVPLLIHKSARSLRPNVKVATLDVRNEVLVGGLNRLVGILVGEEALVGGAEAVSVAPAELDGGKLGLNFAHVSAAGGPVALSSDSVVRGGVLQVLGDA